MKQSNEKAGICGIYINQLNALIKKKGVYMSAKQCFGGSISNDSEKIQEKCLYTLCAVFAILMFARCFFGVEFTDEAYCVSDSLAIMHGNTAYAYATSLIAGQSFVPMIFYKVYELFVPDLEGIFLYSRLCYVLFRLAILLAIYHLLRHDLARKWRLFILLAMIPFMGSIIQNFSYNTIAVYCTLLVSVLLYTSQKDSGKKLYCKLAVSGVFSAISVFAHPVSAIAVIINLILIFRNKVQPNCIQRLLTYCLGGISVIIAVLISIIQSVGIDRLIYGIETILYYRSDVASGSVLSRIFGILNMGGPYFLCLLFGMGCVTVVCSAYIQKKSIRINKEDKRLFVLAISLCVALALAFVVIKSVYFLYVAGMLLFAACILAILTCNMRHSLTWYLLLPNILYTVFLLLFTQTGAPRFYYCIPLMLVILFTMFQSNFNAVKGAAAILAVLFAMMQGYIDYTFVYRDSPLMQLDTCVEQGVYKGIYTTSERAWDVVELETFLSENIDAQDSVAFRDNAPVAYLMRSKNICDVRTWDEMQYTYGCDDPTSMYRYYKNTDSIPDVIAYVDFGRDTVLSIDNNSDTFQYNNFVNHNYDLEEAVLENQTFRVKLYRNNGRFQNEFDELIESAKK